MIEREVIEFVAAADWTDACRVDVQMRRKHMDLSASQARQFARELVDAAEQAERAAASAVRSVVAPAVDLLGSLEASVACARAQTRAIAAEHGATFIGTERLSPDCKASKHPLHQDEAWDDVADVEVPCECSCHATGSAA